MDNFDGALSVVLLVRAGPDRAYIGWPPAVLGLLLALITGTLTSCGPGRPEGGTPGRWPLPAGPPSTASVRHGAITLDLRLAHSVYAVGALARLRLTVRNEGNHSFSIIGPRFDAPIVRGITGAGRVRPTPPFVGTCLCVKVTNKDRWTVAPGQSRSTTAIAYLGTREVGTDWLAYEGIPRAKIRVRIVRARPVRYHLYFSGSGQMFVRLFRPAGGAGPVRFTLDSPCTTRQPGTGTIIETNGRSLKGGWFHSSGDRVRVRGVTKSCRTASLNMYAGWLGYPAAHIRAHRGH